MHNNQPLVQSNPRFLAIYSVFTQKTVCGHDTLSWQLHLVFLTPWVIFRTFAQNRSPSD
jgi:succinate-acetate transporter protein